MSKTPKMLLAHELREQMNKKVAEQVAGRNPNQILVEQYAWDIETYRRLFEITGIYRMSVIVEMALAGAVAENTMDSAITIKAFKKYYAMAQQEMLQGKR